MTQQEIIEMARASGFMPAHDNRVQHFAKLVAAKEREACAVTARLALQHIHKVGEIAEAAIRTRGKA